jgi:CsoR family transcriptional regulator, copper-sensing transcriptional repressor
MQLHRAVHLRIIKDCVTVQNPMKLSNVEAKEKLLSRLHRIEGQVRGIETMINEERDCREILQQFSAIRSAVQSANLSFFEEYATECLLHNNDSSFKEQVLHEMVALLGKTQ